MVKKSYLINYVPGVFVGLSFLLGLLAIQPAMVRSQPAQAVDKKVQKAVLAEDWAKVADILDSIHTKTPSPLLRLIKAHACLALNRNNESLCLFLSMGSEEDLKKWEEWTQDFAEKNSKKAIAYYFKGDASARLKQWDSALMEFNKALEFDPNDALVLNARGTTYSAKGKRDDALLDLTKATTATDSFADAHASLGAMAIQQKEGAKGALEDFNKALEISPDFAIALYGRGCVQLVLGEWEESRKDIENASEKTECLSELIGINVALILKRINADDDIQLAKVTSKNPSFEIQRRLETMQKNRNTGLFATDLKTVVGLGRQHPELLPMINNGLSQVGRNDPKLGQIIHKDLNSLKWHNQVGQGLANVLQGIKGEGGVKGGVAGIGPGGAGWISGYGKLTSDLRPLGQDFKNMTSKNLHIINNIQHGMPSGHPAKGFKTGLEEATWDKGNWPFDALYGLFYKIDSLEGRNRNH